MVNKEKYKIDFNNITDWRKEINQEIKYIRKNLNTNLNIKYKDKWFNIHIGEFGYIYTLPLYQMRSSTNKPYFYELYNILAIIGRTIKAIKMSKKNKTLYVKK